MGLPLESTIRLPFESVGLTDGPFFVPLGPQGVWRVLQDRLEDGEVGMDLVLVQDLDAQRALERRDALHRPGVEIAVERPDRFLVGHGPIVIAREHREELAGGPIHVT